MSSYHRLHVFKRDLFPQHHLVEGSDEKTLKSRKQQCAVRVCVQKQRPKILAANVALKRDQPKQTQHQQRRMYSIKQRTIQQFSMKHSHSCHTSDELEIGEVILVAQAGVGVDLESVVVTAETRGEKKKKKKTVIYICFHWKCYETLTAQLKGNSFAKHHFLIYLPLHDHVKT